MTQQKVQETFAIMESGLLVLESQIQNGILLLGSTKAGKTTTSHYLTHQILKGCKNDGRIIYQVEEGSSKYQDAKIGEKESDSQTRIPNIFNYTINGKNIALVDCPGYLDSYGCLRVVSNRFFHAEVFSKVKNMKFLITFPYDDIKRTAPNLKNTFKEFFNGFNQINNIKEQIYQATSIIVTSVDVDELNKEFSDEIPEWIKQGKEPYNEILKIKFSKIQCEGTQQQFFKGLRDTIIKNNRVFIFEKAVLNVLSKKDNQILKQIEERSKYWQRKYKKSPAIDLLNCDPSIQIYNEEKDLDMQNINFFISEPLDGKKEKFDKELKEIENYFQQSDSLTSLMDVFESLTKDINEQNEQNHILKKIIEIEKKSSQKIKNDQNILALKKKYQNKKKSFSEAIFKSFDFFGNGENSAKSSSKSSSSKGPLFDAQFPVSDLKAFKIIHQIYEKTNTLFYEIKTYEDLLINTKYLKKVLEVIYNLASRKEMKNGKKPKNSVVLDYVYNVYINAVISLKFYKMIVKPKENKPNDNINFIKKDYPSKLNRVFKPNSASVYQVLFTNIYKIKESSLTSAGCEQISIFLEKVLDESIQKKDPSIFGSILNPEQALKKMRIKILRLRVQAFQDQDLNQDMEKFRQKQFIEKKVEDNELNFLHNGLVRIMAQKLNEMGRLDNAIELYQLLQDPHECLQTMTKKMSQKQKDDSYFNCLIKCIEICQKFDLPKTAEEKGIEALSLAKNQRNFFNLSKIKSILYQNSISAVKDKSIKYKEYLFNSGQEPIIEVPVEISKFILGLKKYKSY